MNSFSIEFGNEPTVYSEQMGGATVKQRFTCSYPNLCGVGIQVSNEGRTNSCFIKLTLIRGSDGSKVAEKMFDMSKNPQGTLDLPFRSLSGSENTDYTLIIEESECGRNNSVALLIAAPGSYEGSIGFKNIAHSKKFPSGHVFLRLYFGTEPVQPRKITSTYVKHDPNIAEKEKIYGNLRTKRMVLPRKGNLPVRLSTSDNVVFMIESNDKGGTIKKK